MHGYWYDLSPLDPQNRGLNEWSMRHEDQWEHVRGSGIPMQELNLTQIARVFVPKTEAVRRVHSNIVFFNIQFLSYHSKSEAYKRLRKIQRIHEAWPLTSSGSPNASPPIPRHEKRKTRPAYWFLFFLVPLECSRHKLVATTNRLHLHLHLRFFFNVLPWPGEPGDRETEGHQLHPSEGRWKWPRLPGGAKEFLWYLKPPVWEPWCPKAWGIPFFYENNRLILHRASHILQNCRALAVWTRESVAVQEDGSFARRLFLLPGIPASWVNQPNQPTANCPPFRSVSGWRKVRITLWAPWFRPLWWWPSSWASWSPSGWDTFLGPNVLEQSGVQKMLVLRFERSCWIR